MELTENSLVVFPKLMYFFGERIFGSEGFNFFIRILQDLVNQRADSTEVTRF